MNLKSINQSPITVEYVSITKSVLLRFVLILFTCFFSCSFFSFSSSQFFINTIFHFQLHFLFNNCSSPNELLLSLLQKLLSLLLNLFFPHFCLLHYFTIDLCESMLCVVVSKKLIIFHFCHATFFSHQ